MNSGAESYPRYSHMLSVLGAVLLVIGISMWLPQLPTMGPGNPGVDHTAFVEGFTHQGSQHGGSQGTTVAQGTAVAEVAAVTAEYPATLAVGTTTGEEHPVNSERLTSLSLLLISGALLAALLAAAGTSLGKGLAQLVDLRLSSADHRLSQRFLPVRFSVFLI